MDIQQIGLGGNITMTALSCHVYSTDIHSAYKWKAYYIFIILSSCLVFLLLCTTHSVIKQNKKKKKRNTTLKGFKWLFRDMAWILFLFCFTLMVLDGIVWKTTKINLRYYKLWINIGKTECSVDSVDEEKCFLYMCVLYSVES